jgi:uncharacterized membrane protein
MHRSLLARISLRLRPTPVPSRRRLVNVENLGWLAFVRLLAVPAPPLLHLHLLHLHLLHLHLLHLPARISLRLPPTPVPSRRRLVNVENLGWLAFVRLLAVPAPPLLHLHLLHLHLLHLPARISLRLPPTPVPSRRRLENVENLGWLAFVRLLAVPANRPPLSALYESRSGLRNAVMLEKHTQS